MRTGLSDPVTQRIFEIVHKYNYLLFNILNKIDISKHFTNYSDVEFYPLSEVYLNSSLSSKYAKLIRIGLSDPLTHRIFEIIHKKNYLLYNILKKIDI